MGILAILVICGIGLFGVIGPNETRLSRMYKSTGPFAQAQAYFSKLKQDQLLSHPDKRVRISKSNLGLHVGLLKDRRLGQSPYKPNLRSEINAPRIDRMKPKQLVDTVRASFKVQDKLMKNRVNEVGFINKVGHLNR